MLIAHAPAGYLLGRLLTWVVNKQSAAIHLPEKNTHSLEIACMIGCTIPDLDFIYHIFIDSARTPHHSYVTHMPIFWIGIWLVLFIIGKLRRNGNLVKIATAFCLGAILHQLLDTFTGKIYWFYPFSGSGVNFFAVADVNVWWVENFTRHWTFIFEIALITAAMTVYLGPKKTLLDILFLFRQEKFRTLFVKGVVCACCIAAILFIGTVRFNVDSHALEMVIKLKHRITRIL